MSHMMKAAVVDMFGKPLTLREWEIPTVGPGQILVKTEACGVCHTDLHAARGDWPVKPTPPFIPGHEGIGIIVEVGAGVTIVKQGDRVGVPWMYSACGHCEYCLSAWETVCPDMQFSGYTQNGGFAEYILADPNYVAIIPDGGRGGTDHLRRHHYLQGIEGNRRAPWRMGGHIRRRRIRASGRAICQGDGITGLRDRCR